ncbi:MAG: alpha/beta fold hydrolase [Desulfobulbaceae bacterium]|nr:alpha/beta fold hydrolase [Desulfobulbaceae bacterium]
MKYLKLLFIMSLVLLPALCPAAGDGYGYPILDSYAATIMGTPDKLKLKHPEGIPSRELVIHPILNLKKPDVFFYDNGLRCALAYQKKKAPLIFLIAGTGSSYNAPKLMAMMNGLYNAGFHVITLSSPTHPNFVINASRSHIPGNLTEDAADLYQVMETAWNHVKGDIEVSNFCLSGYSLGATQAAFVAKLDDERKVFNFNKVLLINPAVSLYDSVKRIEALLDGIPGGPKKIGAFFNRMLNRFVEFYREGDFIEVNNEFLYEVYKADLVSRDEAGGLIGLSFRINSAGMLFASDVMTNGGYIVPKNRVLKPSDPLEDYFRVGVYLSFIQYFNEYFYPYFRGQRPGLTREQLIQSLSLKSIEGYLKSNPKFGVMTNENDFILSSADREYLRQLFGEATKVYPRGGHLGNLEYRDNMVYMTDFVGFFN